jgi:DNA-binding transcriptional LysR family regulator
VDIRDLLYFETIAEMGHLGRAAEQLGRTQPALTKCIRRLEDEMVRSCSPGGAADCS